VTIRPAQPRDAHAIAAIHTEGIEGRGATFQTGLQTAEAVRGWFAGRGPFLVAEGESGVVGWARVGEYSDFLPYAGVGEFAIYVTAAARGQGLGRELLAALCEAAERDGRYKLVGKIFPENEGSLAICRVCGFREVGVHRRHGVLDGTWRDVTIVERLLGPGAEER
jgi:phosphinothricin acetyltransferase